LGGKATDRPLSRVLGGGRHDFAAFVTEIAQLQRRLVTHVPQYTNRSRCPGEVPSSPWRLTGSGGVTLTIIVMMSRGNRPNPAS
jgi:hypothetical protein